MTSAKLIWSPEDDPCFVPTDLPTVVADFLAETNLVHRGLSAVCRFLAKIPVTVVSWLGPELKTPDNSEPPRFIPAEAGPWNGVVFIEQDDPRYWVLAKAQGRNQHQPPMNAQRERFQQSYGERYDWPPGTQRSPYGYEEQEPDYFARPWEPGLWRDDR